MRRRLADRQRRASTARRWRTRTRRCASGPSSVSQRYPPRPGRAGRRPRGDPDRPGGALPGDPGRAAARGRPGRGALPDPARVRDALGDHRADDHARPHARRAHVRERPVGAALRRAGPGARRGARRGAARRRSTTPASTRERAYIARTLQESLLPVELPDIPGIEAAARFRPTGEGNEVGGDFYDLFETGNRGWTVVMGDVCGKGPDAAAVTALARYTLRAAAMRERLPSRSLGRAERGAAAPARRPPLLHRRLRLPREARPRARAWASPAAGIRCRCCCAPTGPSRPVGEPGTLLGVVPDPDLEDRAVDARARRRARLLHGRRDRGPRRVERRSTSAGSPSWWPPAPAPGPTRSPPGSRRPLSCPRADGRGTTSPCSCSAWPRLEVADVARPRWVELALRVHLQHGHHHGDAHGAWRGTGHGRGLENEPWERSRGGSRGAPAISRAASRPRSTPDGDAAPARDRAGHEQRPAHRCRLAHPQGGDRQGGGAHRGGRRPARASTRSASRPSSPATDDTRLGAVPRPAPREQLGRHARRAARSASGSSCAAA